MAKDATRRSALDAAHPMLRAVGPPDAPYPGVLRRTGDGITRLFVDSEVYGSPTAWSSDPAGHVLAPLDVARRRDGHEVVLAHCVERIDDLLARRADAEPLADGETVTLAVSLRRGLAEVLAAGEDPTAEWWLADDGRPVLACVADARPATEATVRIVTTLARDTASPVLAAALGTLAEAAVEPRRLARDATAIEDALFAAAAPMPLERERVTGRSSLAGLVAVTPTAIEPPPDRWEEVLRGHLDGDLADLTTAAVRSVRDRIAARRGGVAPCPRPDRRPARRRDAAGPGRGPSRTRPWLVAACLAVAVVGAGLLWPSSGDPATAEGSSSSGGGGPSAAAPVAADGGAPAIEAPSGDAVAEDTDGDAEGETSGVHTPAEAADREGPAPGWDPGDPVAAATALLAAARSCGGEPACTAALVEDAAASTTERLAAVASVKGTPELVDDFGGAAVVRIAHDSGSSLVVVVQATAAAAGPGGAGWLVRDVYDVADQP